MTSVAQTTSPANVEAEKALRGRAEQFYQLEVDGKFRAAEALVADDTKDYYFNNGKPNMLSYKLGNIEFQDPTHATITLIATVRVTAPGLGIQNLPATANHTWKLENGQWCWYVDQKAGVDTPFGKMSPGPAGATGSILPIQASDLRDVDKLVSIDRTTVDLSSGAASSVTISNRLPGAITLEIGSNRPAGLIIEADKTTIGQGEKATISFRATGSAKPTGTVHITAMPLSKQFVIQIGSSPAGTK